MESYEVAARVDTLIDRRAHRTFTRQKLNGLAPIRRTPSSWQRWRSDGALICAPPDPSWGVTLLVGRRAGLGCIHRVEVEVESCEVAARVGTLIDRRATGLLRDRNSTG